MNFVPRCGLALAASLYLVFSGLKKRSLSRSGACAAFFVGLVSLSISARLGLTLILFYKSSSILTKVGQKKKAQLDDHHVTDGQRTATQVLSCSGIACVVAVIMYYLEGEDMLAMGVNYSSHPTTSFLLCAYLGHYACCNGDTWSSELGVLSRSPPILITQPWRTVPAGTNGGVSTMGTLAAGAAGVVIGAGFLLFGWMQGAPQDGQYLLIPFGGMCGLLGSMLDSLMGATLQATYYDREKKCITSKVEGKSSDVVRVCGYDILTNEQVNLLSVLVTTIGSGYMGALMF